MSEASINCSLRAWCSPRLLWVGSDTHERPCLIGNAQGLSIRRSCLNLLVTLLDWLDDVLDAFADTVRRHPSYCHGFLLAVMYNHRGLEQYQACEDLSLLFNDKTSLEMRTWCIHKETLNDMTKWGSFLIPLAVSDRVSKTTNKREKNKLD